MNDSGQAGQNGAAVWGRASSLECILQIKWFMGLWMLPAVMSGLILTFHTRGLAIECIYLFFKWHGSNCCVWKHLRGCWSSTATRCCLLTWLWFWRLKTAAPHLNRVEASACLLGSRLWICVRTDREAKDKHPEQLDNCVCRTGRAGLQIHDDERWRRDERSCFSFLFFRSRTEEVTLTVSVLPVLSWFEVFALQMHLLCETFKHSGSVFIDNINGAASLESKFQWNLIPRAGD